MKFHVFPGSRRNVKTLLLVMLKDEPTLIIDIVTVLTRFSFTASTSFHMVLAMSDQ